MALSETRGENEPLAERSHASDRERDDYVVAEAIARLVVELTVAFVLKHILPIVIRDEPTCLRRCGPPANSGPEDRRQKAA